MGEKIEGYSEISFIFLADWTLVCTRYIGYEAMNIRYVEYTQNIKINWPEGAKLEVSFLWYTYHGFVLEVVHEMPS